MSDTFLKERLLLSCLLLSPDTLVYAQKYIRTPRVFNDQRNRAIYHALTVLVPQSNGKPPEATKILDWVEKHNPKAGVSLDYILSLMSESPSPANVEDYARDVQQAAALRWSAEQLRMLTMNVENGHLEVDELVKKLEYMSTTLALRGQANPTVCGVKEVFKELQEVILNRDKRMRGISTYRNLDNYLGGLCPGELIIAAGRPSMGKTALLLNLYLRAMSKGHKPCLFTLEVNAEHALMSMLSILSNIPITRIRSGDYTSTERDLLNDWGVQLSEYDAMINDTSGIRIDELALQIKLAVKHKGADVIFVDYLQFIRGLPSDSREQEVATITRILKECAVQCNVPIVAAAQLNRMVEVRGDKKPKLSDLRESGEIEQSADKVILLYRPEYYDPNREKDTLYLIVAKNRFGATGEVNLRFDKPVLRIHEWNEQGDIQL